MKYKAMLAAALFLTGGSAFAAPVSYVCEYAAYTRTGWVPEKALYIIDEAKGTASAYDGFIRHLREKPMAVEMQKSGKTIRMNYTLDGIPMQGNSLGYVSYTVRLNPTRGKSSMTVILRGFDNEIRGSGKCAVQNG